MAVVRTDTTPDHAGISRDVTVVGIGGLGVVLARAFLGAGHRTTVWNRTPAKAAPLVAEGAVHAEDLAEAVAASDVVVVVLPDYATVRDVLGPVADLLRGRVVVNLTSGTPEIAREMAEWARERGVEYLDGAAMSGTRLVGRPEALFVLSGPAPTFAAAAPLLTAWGNAVHVGEDPGIAAVYDTALFGLIWGAMAGFQHGVALTGSAGVDARAFAAVAAGHMSFVASLFAEQARQFAEGVFPDDDGSVDVHIGAMEHVLHSSRDQGLATDVPELFLTLLRSASAAGHGADGIASVASVIREGGQHA